MQQWRPGRRAAWVAGLSAAAVVAATIAFASLYQVGRSSWAYSGDTGAPEFGASFSCAQLLHLMKPQLDEWVRANPGHRSPSPEVEFCLKEFEALVLATGLRQVRLSLSWNEAESSPGIYTFGSIEGLLGVAEKHNVGVLLVVGMRVPRHPEFAIPTFYGAESRVRDGGDPSSDPVIREAARRFIEAGVRRLQSWEVIEAWQAENEPYVPTPRAHDWELGEQWVSEVVALIRANDPRSRPVVVSHSSKFATDDGWRAPLRQGDVLAQSVYPRRHVEIAGLFFAYPSLLSGPVAPNFPAQARAARAEGKQFWLSEMQAEPWDDVDNFELGGRDPESMSPGIFRQHLEMARRSGASRVYLWGAEWWHFRAMVHGDGAYLAIAAGALSSR